jgi:hypothetical protein
VQTRPTDLVDLSIGQADCAGQSDSFNEAEHIRPNFNGQKNNFAEISNKIYLDFKHHI